MSPTIQDLPPEILLLIFKKLSFKEVIENCSKTCENWERIVVAYFMQPRLKKLSACYEREKQCLDILGWTEDCYEPKIIIPMFEVFVSSVFPEKPKYFKLNKGTHFNTKYALYSTIS